MGESDPTRPSRGLGGRIRKTREFKQVLAAGKRIRGEGVQLHLLHKPQSTQTRLGLSLSRRVGPAVRRNRSKRLVREAFFLHQHQLPPGTDLVVTVQQDLSRMKLREVEALFVRVMRRLELPGSTQSDGRGR